ncbi:MAG: hypothetical protein HC815_30830 [Richelia sp. RM1_1_1]|nr:hypothetical protein [Richelia sp. RM1_1_1]
MNVSQLKLKEINEAIRDAGFKPQQLLFAGGLGIAALFSIPSIQKYSQTQAIRQAEIRKIDRLAESQRNQLLAEQNAEEIANERYKSCIPVVGKHYKNGTHYFTSLKAGDVPVDRITGKPFAPGVKVCDALGTTGIIDESGKIINTLFTGDRDVIHARLKRFRGSQFSQPVLANNQKEEK